MAITLHCTQLSFNRRTGHVLSSDYAVHLILCVGPVNVALVRVHVDIQCANYSAALGFAAVRAPTCYVPITRTLPTLTRDPV